MACFGNCSSTSTRLDGGFLELEDLFNYFEYRPWLFSLIGSAMVGLSGVFPLLVIPIDAAADLKHGGKFSKATSDGFRLFIFFIYFFILAGSDLLFGSILILT